MRIVTYVLLPLLLLLTAAADAQQAGYEKTFKKFIVDMESTFRSQSAEGFTLEVKVKIEDALVELSEDETYYEGTGTITHELYTHDTPAECSFIRPILEDGEMRFRIEVDEYFDAAPDVRIYVIMTQATFPREGSVVECITPNGPVQTTNTPQPAWAAGFISTRHLDGSTTDPQKGILIDDVTVEGWKITGLEEQDFRVYKELDFEYTDPDDGTKFWEDTKFELEPCLLYKTGYGIRYDGFSFANATDNIWPQHHWTPFGERYEAMDSVFLDVTGEPAASDWPDFWSFADVFADEVYIDDQNSVYNHLALMTWADQKKAFNGACYGFSYSSLLHYCGYEGILPQPIFLLQLSNLTRNEIIHKYLYQWSAKHKNAIRSGYSNTSPKQLIENIVENFEDDGSKNAGMGIIRRRGGHSIVPYKLVRCIYDDRDEIISEIICYDNNSPGSPRTIKVDETKNKVIDEGEFSKGYFLTIPSDRAQGPFILAKQSKSPRLLASDRTMVLLGENASATVGDGSGATIASGDIDPAGLPGAQPLVQLTGLGMVHNGFEFPSSQSDTWEIALQPESGGSASASVVSPAMGARLFFGNAAGTMNFTANTAEAAADLAADQPAQNTRLIIVRDDPAAQFTALMRIPELGAGSGLSARIPESGAMFVLENKGSSGFDYSVNLMRSASTFTPSGRFDGLYISAGATHRFIVGSRDSLGTTFIAAEVDEGSNGMADDVIVLRPYKTSTSVDRPVALNADLRAWPSPWNPGLQPLRIRYSMRQPATARLVVYNSLQQQVAEIVPPRRHEAGANYRVTWDGRTAAGTPVPSGTYFYVLESARGARAIGKVAVVR